MNEKVKIALCSDVHLEFLELVIENTENADVLILSGDILLAEDLHDIPAPDPYSSGGMAKYTQRLKAVIRYRDFIKQCSEKFPNVIAVAGNHEFYNGKFHQSLDVLRKEYGKYPNIHFLENDAVKLNGLTFLGATLWTDFNKKDPLSLKDAEYSLNDYKEIRNDKVGYRKLRATDVYDRHVESLKYFKDTIQAEPLEQYVLAVHHAPSKLSTHPMYQKDYHLNGAYSSDLSEFILDHPQIKLITHGHTHFSFDYMIGSTRIACNPRGYAGYEKIAEDFKLQYLEV
jgi:Icc-related predicted phosphoesterase